MLITCAMCGEQVPKSNKKAVYCSKDCYNKYRKLHWDRKDFECGYCGKPFTIGNWLVERGSGKYCSRKCRIEAKRSKVEVTCSWCGKEILVCPDRLQNKDTHCSRACKAMTMRTKYIGEDSWSWKGGATSEDKRIRSTAEYKDWRESVFARDDWTCQDCGARNGNGRRVVLQAHHIFPFKDFEEHRLCTWNGTTLCLACHHLSHGRVIHKEIECDSPTTSISEA